MHNDVFVSNAVSPYYLHAVKTDTEAVTGILFKLNVTKENLEHLIPHEDIDISKVAKITNALLSEELDRLPIILGASDGGFLNLLEGLEHNNLDSVVSSGNALKISQEISIIRDFILIDGHHRHAAAKKALKLDKKVHLWCWIVPFNKLKIHSFIKVFTNHGGSINIDKIINKNYKVLHVAPECNEKDGLNIVLSLHGYHYQLLSKSEDDFLCEMKNLKDKLEQNKLVLVEKYEKLSDANNISIIDNVNGNLILRHAQVTHEMVLNTVKCRQILPLHSTCFKPKPEHIQIDISV